jgi:hypothetical protein
MVGMLRNNTVQVTLFAGRKASEASLANLVFVSYYKDSFDPTSFFRFVFIQQLCPTAE